MEIEEKALLEVVRAEFEAHVAEGREMPLTVGLQDKEGGFVKLMPIEGERGSAVGVQLFFTRARMLAAHMGAVFAATASEMWAGDKTNPRDDPDRREELWLIFENLGMPPKAYRALINKGRTLEPWVFVAGDMTGRAVSILPPQNPQGKVGLA